MPPLLDASGAPTHALDAEEVARRPLSLRLLLLVVGGTISVAGAIFTAGSKWGGSSTADAAALSAIRVGLASNVAAIEALSTRLATVETTKTTLVPAVDRLSVQTDKLAEAVGALRETLAAQNVEIRNLKDAVGELRAKVK